MRDAIKELKGLKDFFKGRQANERTMSLLYCDIFDAIDARIQALKGK